MKGFNLIQYLSPRMNPTRSRLYDPIHWIISRRRFLAGLADVRGVEDAINLAWSYRGLGIYRRAKPSQDRSEFTQLALRVSAINPRVIVEIGTNLGGTLLVWSQASADLRMLVSIDLPGGIHGGGYSRRLTKFFRLFAANHPALRLELLRKDSHQDSTRDQVVTLLNQQPIDFLFIDGDHRYPGVRRDYELYAPLVRPGGIIAFHDIRVNFNDPSIEVHQLWDEIKQNDPQAVEIVTEPYQGQCGIGLVYKSQM